MNFKTKISKLKNILYKDQILFDGDDALFKKTVGECKVYAEYGCGASTIWVANHTTAKIYSVDTSEVWLGKVEAACNRKSGLNLHHTNLGVLGSWGRPLGYDYYPNFEDYTDWIWRQEICPDVVLIDGRFRVCCFLSSLLNAREGCIIIFDDYIDRKFYHIAELFLRPSGFCGRQAYFIVPEKDFIDIELIKDFVNRFRFVMD